MYKKRAFYRMPRHPVTQPSDPSYRIIPLTQGQNAIVDTEDYDRLNQYNWCASWNVNTKSFYATRGENYSSVQMSREILGCSPDREVDHRNHDTLDNRKKNLRIATSGQNGKNKKRRSTNKSGYIGVSKHKNGKWQANVGLGLFNTKEEAARARDVVVKMFHGEFAVLNFP